LWNKTNLNIKLWRPTFACIRGPYCSRRYYNIRFSRLCLSMYGLSIDQYWVVCSRPKVRNDFRVKTMMCSSLLHFLSFRLNVLLMLYVYIYVFWCATRFPCLIIFVSFSSNMTGVTFGAWTDKFSITDFIGVRVTRYSVFYVVFFR
jgi:hypothetical protein